MDFLCQKISLRIQYYYNEFSFIQQVSNIQKTSIGFGSLIGEDDTYEKNVCKV